MRDESKAAFPGAPVMPEDEARGVFPRGEIMPEPDEFPDGPVDGVVDAYNDLVALLETHVEEAEKKADGLESWIESHLEYGIYGEARITRLQRAMTEAAHVLARGRRGRHGRHDAREAMGILLAAALRSEENDLDRVC